MELFSTVIGFCAICTSPKGYFSKFKKEFNWVRPHEALKGKCPSDVYVPSPRKFDPKSELLVAYPEHYAIRVVKHNGGMKWKSKELHIGQALQGEPLGLEQISDRYWRVYFMEIPNAILDEYNLKIIRYGTSELNKVLRQHKVKV